MNKILQNPLLPQGKVTSAAVSAEYSEITEALKNLNIDCFEVPASDKLTSSIASHADCRIIQLSKNIFICERKIADDFAEFIGEKANVNVKILTNREAENILNLPTDEIYIMKEEVNSPYPDDVRLNAKLTADFVICNTRFISPIILNYAISNKIKIIHTKQGYSACSTVLLNQNTIITDDVLINSAANRKEIFSTILSKGDIKLKDCNYGFIGGCCGFIDKNLIAFTGKLNSHRDYKLIENILSCNHIEYIELTNNELFDIGGIIPLTENI